MPRKQTPDEIAARLPLIEAELATLDEQITTLDAHGAEASEVRRRRARLWKTRSYLRHIERRRAEGRAYKRVYDEKARPPEGRPLGDPRAVRGRQIRAVSSRRTPPAEGDRCPRPGCGKPLGRDPDGLYCLCGWHEWSAPRPWQLEAS